MNSLISIIIPVYNVEKYLHRCIDSILRQTYKNLEIILVNDGSLDSCGIICDEYVRLDDRVKVIHKKNGGLSDARNEGIDIAKGKYISFIDSDDWVHDEYIDKLYKLIKKTNSDISVCNFMRTSDENFEIDNSIEEIYEFSNFEALEQFADKFYLQMVVAWGKLYKKNLFKDIRFPFGKIHEDEFTTHKLIYEAKKVALTTAKLLYYWQREDSIMGRGFDIKNRLDVIDALKERAEFFEEIGMKDMRNKTYRTLFLIYMEANRKIQEFDNESHRERLNINFKSLKDILIKSNDAFKIKAFYRLYFAMPKVMNLAYITYSAFSIKNRRINS